MTDCHSRRLPGHSRTYQLPTRGRQEVHRQPLRRLETTQEPPCSPAKSAAKSTVSGRERSAPRLPGGAVRWPPSIPQRTGFQGRKGLPGRQVLIARPVRVGSGVPGVLLVLFPQDSVARKPGAVKWKLSSPPQTAFKDEKVFQDGKCSSRGRFALALASLASFWSFFR
jgi:hypothetical protein